MPPDTERVLVAVGGNAIHPGEDVGTAEQQAEFAKRCGKSILPLLQRPSELIITHGNGPVVGKILMRQALSTPDVPPMPMDICVAHSQGGIAYLLMQAFENALREVGDPRHVVCLLTQVEVDENDPAFSHPTKPVGFFYSKEEAEKLQAELGWCMREDSGRGWRYVVPSPDPTHVADISLVSTVAASGAVVIAGGGGGIPVIRTKEGLRQGISAVIDKDKTSAKMAALLNCDVFLMLTAVPNVSVNFGKLTQRPLGTVSVREMRMHLSDGQFGVGSMQPKIEAALRFVENTGKPALIAHLDDAIAALNGVAGTRIVPDA